VNIKAQGLLNAVRWIEEEYGQEALRDVLRECSPAVRERYMFAIAINWHPLGEFIELLTVVERRLGKGDGKLAEAIGAAGARANMKGILLRLAQYLVAQDYLAKRIAGMWRQFNDQGEMRVLSVAEAHVVLEMAGVPESHWLFCCTLTGWCREISSALGVRNATARHIECRTKGSERCVYEVRGTAGPPKPPPPPPSRGTLPG
jgi:predicted hydrocarbon binding protein